MKKALYKASISIIIIDAIYFACVYFRKMDVTFAFLKIATFHLLVSIQLHQYFIDNYYTEYSKKKKKEK